MAQRDNLYRRPSGIYVLRITVPVRYRALIGQREIHASTRTTHLADARAIAARLLDKWYASLEEFRQVDKEKIRGNAPLLTGAGKISLTLFCESFGVGVETVIQHLLTDNVPLYALVSNQRGFLIDDFSTLERDPDTHGFVLNNIAYDGAEAAVNGYMQLYQPQFALIELLNGREVEVTAFRANNGNPLSLWLLDLPGVTLDASSLFINNVQAEKLRSVWDRALAKSEPSTTPPTSPTVLTAALSSAAIMNPYCNPMHASMTVSAVLEEFLAYKNTGDIKLASEEKIRSRIEHFTEIMGDISLGELDREVVKDYVTRMQSMPGNLYLMRRKYKISDTHKLIEKALADGQPVMSRDAIGRHIESLGSMLKWAKSERYLFDNPAENILAQSRPTVREQDRRDLFTEDELLRIFSADWFKNGAGTPNQYGRYTNFRPFHYWLPLLALYVGGRINELCQLYLADIRVDKNGVAYIDFNLDAPDKMMDEEALAGGDKSLKTVNAIRQVPIHPRLIELGLLKYVDALEAAGYDRLFPELKHNKIKGYRAAASKWFNENYFGKVLGFPRDGKKTFHSLRHTFINAVDEFESNERTIAQLVGHVRGSTTAMTTYRKDADVGEQLGVIAQLRYSLPDIAQFDSQAGIKAVIDARRRHKS
ncbi:site-specific integrase [Klebsiella sp. RHBSTW-00484]|uniref:site-specific integrase n=1 Tax=unclassified Klebsiella TaxID=2608929 RepID=UPI0015E5629C|nr:MULTISPECIES: site-specific integrase [unclassified Klebsiella]QLO35341.1 site-specific integrase [Klebsiella sp. RHBSTW-00484]QLT74855.1 site-specific integrase [Klebsiella sp. RHBSTW-00464]